MNLHDLLQITDGFYQYAKYRIPFDSDGWPIFKREYFLDEWPQDMVTYDNRNSRLIAPKSETLLCFYMGDVQNYRRFANLHKDIPIYKQYKGVVVPDVTITYDMDYEFQSMLMLANQLFAAVLAANGVKIVLNTRNGSHDSLMHFKNIPRHIMCASGFLGCRNAGNAVAAAPYTNKILSLLPSKLLIYGKPDKAVNEQLDSLGIDYHYYEDFHTRSKHNSKMNRRAA